MFHVLTHVFRFLVGGLFIFSGLIKANDPAGFAIKLNEYFTVFGTEFMKPASLSLAVLICMVEVVLGAALLLGYRARQTVLLLMAMNVFFAFLTGWSAIFNVVTDCGCFGDAIPLTPWQSFTKNLILIALIGWLIPFHHYIQPMGGSPRAAFGGTLLSGGLTFGFAFYCAYFLPVMDFRPYKVGNDIYALSRMPADAPRDEYETMLVYEHKETGKEKEFTMEAYSQQNIGEKSDTWKWKDTRNKLVRKGYKPPIHDFSIIDAKGKDYTQSFFAQKGMRMMIVQPKLEETDAKAQKKVQQLVHEVLLPNGIRVWALTATPPDEQEAYVKAQNLHYPLFNTDATALKTMIRANPGLILLKNNTIKAKWPGTNLPDSAEVVAHLP